VGNLQKLDMAFTVQERHHELTWKELPENSGKIQLSTNVKFAMEQAFANLMLARSNLTRIKDNVPDLYEMLQHDDNSYVHFAAMVAAILSENMEVFPSRDRSKKAARKALLKGISAMRILRAMDLTYDSGGEPTFKINNPNEPSFINQIFVP